MTEPASPNTSSSASVSSSTTAEPSKITILLIEDNPGDVRLMKEWLSEARRDPFELKVAGKLGEGMPMVALGNIDLALVDLSLPDSNGLDTFIRFHVNAPSIPVIVMTGLDDETVGLKALQAGAQDYLVKGQVDARLLSRAIHYAIERQKIVARLEQSTRELQNSRAQFRQMIERNADGMIVVDQRGVIRFANPSAESLYMRWAEELVGSPFDQPLEATQAPREIQIQRIDGTTIKADLRMVEIQWETEPAFLASLRTAGSEASPGAGAGAGAAASAPPPAGDPPAAQSTP